MQHHGSTNIRYFLDIAAQAGEITDLENFRYPGPKPMTKEAALVMLADVIESTTKSKNVSTEEDIAKIIDDTIQRLIREGQFDEAPISIRDLNKVKKSMLPVLDSIYRKRLDYPESPVLGNTENRTDQ
jgi:membrane-associated HD superfamily phosphohydrolase